MISSHLMRRKSAPLRCAKSVDDCTRRVQSDKPNPFRSLTLLLTAVPPVDFGGGIVVSFMFRSSPSLSSLSAMVESCVPCSPLGFLFASVSFLFIQSYESQLIGASLLCLLFTFTFSLLHILHVDSTLSITWSVCSRRRTLYKHE